MELEPIGMSGVCFKPDATHPHNYMLDTSAINKIYPKTSILLAQVSDRGTFV